MKPAKAALVLGGPLVARHCAGCGRDHAQGALRPGDAHHHSANGDPAIGDRAGVHGAPLAIGDLPPVRSGDPGHCRPYRHPPCVRAFDPDNSKLEQIARNRLDLEAEVLPAGPLPPALPKPFFSLVDRAMSSEIARQIKKPFWIDTVGRSDFIEVRIDMGDAICVWWRGGVRLTRPTPISLSSGWSGRRRC